jgi:hypothetical protein
MHSSNERPDPVENAYLTAYPNPNRIGCAGSKVLRGLADRTLSISHPARMHIAQCSPCFQEFREIERELRRNARRQGRLLRIAAIAAILIVTCVLSIPFLKSHSQSVNVAAIINFATTSADRGIPENRLDRADVQSYPRTQLRMTVNLPPGSDRGKYEFQIMQGEAVKPLVSSIGAAKIENGLTTFATSVDLSHLEPGIYLARVRSVPLGGWHSLSVEIK